MKYSNSDYIAEASWANLSKGLKKYGKWNISAYQTCFNYISKSFTLILTIFQITKDLCGVFLEF